MGCQSRTVSGETVCIYPLFAGSLEVEPRGFEPPTSAVQSQIHNVVVVRYCSEILANWHIHPFALSSLFAVVCAGWCPRSRVGFCNASWGCGVLKARRVSFER